MDTAHGTVPPVARRTVVAPATALQEELNDSWRLLLGCVGATGAVSLLLFVLTSLLG